jgi:hypothetical protein
MIDAVSWTSASCSGVTGAHPGLAAQRGRFRRSCGCDWPSGGAGLVHGDDVRTGPERGACRSCGDRLKTGSPAHVVTNESPTLRAHPGQLPLRVTAPPERDSISLCGLPWRSSLTRRNDQDVAPPGSWTCNAVALWGSRGIGATAAADPPTARCTGRECRTGFVDLARPAPGGAPRPSLIPRTVHRAVAPLGRWAYKAGHRALDNPWREDGDGG